MKEATHTLQAFKLVTVSLFVRRVCLSVFGAYSKELVVVVMAMALSQTMAVQAHGLPHLPPATLPSQQPCAFASHSGLCMRRRLTRRAHGAVASGGLFRGWGVVPRRVGRVLCAVVDGSGDDAESDKEASDEEASDDKAKQIAALEGAAAAVDSGYNSRRDMLQEYVKNVQPEFMERFVQKAPTQVVEAMRQTVTNMLGTLPPQFFDIHVSTIAENLAQLMYSVMMTGYMMRNAQYRLELQQSLTQAALPVASNATSESRYAPGTQKSSVSGDVVRWRKDEERPERVDAVEYIELLEAEVEELKKQLELRGRGKNELLEYLKSLQPQNLQELTTSAGEDALEAMNTFVARLIGVAEPTQLKRAATQTTATELARILYWLMVVGYSIRNIEVRYDMERVLGVPPKLAELPPGETL